MEVPGWIGIAGIVSALMAGAGLGWLARAPVPTAPLPLTASSIRGSSPHATPHVPTAPPPRRSDPSTCETELALVRSAYEALEIEAFGQPRAFPADLPPAFTPDGFREAVDALVRECPELGLSEPVVDCDEFPCQVAFLVGRDTNRGFDSWGLNTCADWDRRFNGAGAGTSTSKLMLNGEERASIVFSLGSRDHPDPDGSSKRAFHRFNLNHGRLADSLGGRELDVVERAESSVRFLEGAMERTDDPVHRAQLQEALDRARLKAQKLRDLDGGDVPR